MKFRFYEIGVIVTILIMVILFLHGCYSPFRGDHTFVASPSYVVDGSLYIKKADVKLNSKGQLMWNSKSRLHTIPKTDEIRSLYEQGKILTTSEFASNITEYYNTLVSVLVGLFILFSIFGYYTLNDRFKKELEDKEKGLEEKLIQIVKEKLRDSKNLHSVIADQFRSDLEEWTFKKEDKMEIMADIDKIKSDINTLYELSEEFMSNDKSV